MTSSTSSSSSSLSPSVNLTSLLALMIAIVALAFAPILVRLVDAEPSTIAFWRMAFAIPVLLTAWIFLPAKSKEEFIKPTKRSYWIMIFGGVAFAINLIAWNFGLNNTSIANATLFVNFAPIIVGLMTWLLFHEVLPIRLVVGMIIAIAGGFLLIWPKMKLAQESVSGDAYCLLAACFYGSYLLTVQRARQYFSTFAIMTITTLVTGITCLVAALLFGEELIAATAQDWQALIALALVVQVLGQSMIAYALAKLPATLSSIILLMQPVVAAIIAMIIFDEQLLIIQWLGMFVVLLGIATTKKYK